MTPPTKRCPPQSGDTFEGGWRKRPRGRAHNARPIRPDTRFDDLVRVATATSLAIEKDGNPKPRIAYPIGLFFDGIAWR
ncbi:MULTISPECIES: hypothetical protein [Burkholderia cepacia complex]|uniref:hypothetical protein n=1 Tax=Burkholderia cepacia complex TaxID=87882 RepID=UPI0023DE1817|nr:MULTISPECIES: hypothetical protein [Burkholderia cepacia complex]MDF3088694.1 hypothetical protein [Burkholderia semiarida]MDF3102051.1 hypothetical protein [Burkholderia semiarida]